MKTMTFLLLCLFSSIGFTQLSAQVPPDNKKGTGSTILTLEIPDWYEPVYCDRNSDYFTEYVDELVGYATLVETDLFKDGEIVKGSNHINGVLQSVKTGEYFRLHENIKGYALNNPDGNFTNGSWHFNITGEWGTHYIGSFSFYNNGYPDMTVIINKAVCPGEE